ncbi:MAG: hypothetical protein AB1755_03375 [Candidatus Omnitrophota bacterium]
MKRIEILSNKQVWDVKGIDKDNPELTFEALFSGGALEKIINDFEFEYRKKNKKGIFSDYSENNRIRGMAVTKALLSSNPLKIKFAKHVLAMLGKNGAEGIFVLDKGLGYKNWNRKDKNCWSNIDKVVIGGGVSKDYTGKILISAIKKNLNKNGLNNIKIFQAKFPGKESGFLGAVVNLLPRVFKEKSNNIQAVIGVDLGRDKIGAGFIVIDTKKRKILGKLKTLWHSIIVNKTPGGHNLKIFVDSKKKYSKREAALGLKIRSQILEKIVELIVENVKIITAQKLAYSKFIGLSIPGEVDKDGGIIGSAHYLPFFKLSDNFQFKAELKKVLCRHNLVDLEPVVINDGVAAGLSNVYFDDRIKSGKVIFLGVGSGLGSFIGRIK